MIPNAGHDPRAAWPFWRNNNTKSLVDSAAILHSQIKSILSEIITPPLNVWTQAATFPYKKCDFSGTMVQAVPLMPNYGPVGF